MIGESTTPSVTNIQCILNKLEEVITAKHYSKQNFFVSCLAVKENAAASSQNQALSALLFLYKNILGVTIKSPENIVRAKKQKKPPTVLSREETAKIFSLLPENDYGLFIRLLYGRYNFGSCNTAASLTDEFAMRQTSHMIHARSAYEFSSRIKLIFYSRGGFNTRRSRQCSASGVLIRLLNFKERK